MCLTSGCQGKAECQFGCFSKVQSALRIQGVDGITGASPPPGEWGLSLDPGLRSQWSHCCLSPRNLAQCVCPRGSFKAVPEPRHAQEL